MQRPEYKEVFAISQSAIKAFKTKPLQKFKEVYIDKIEEDVDDSKFAFGSLVDTLAFQPELMPTRFYIPDVNVNVPGDKVKFIVDKVYKEAKEIISNKEKLNEQGNLPEPLFIPDIRDLYNFTDLILKYAAENKYGGSTWSKSRIIDNVTADGHDYFRMLGDCNGRMLITASENADAIEVVEALRKDKISAPYFTQQEGETLLFQQEIFTEYIYESAEKSLVIMPLKAALDIIRINHNEKWVQVPDLKTTHNSDGFKTVAKSFDYITQVSFYCHLVKEFMKEYEGGKYSDYELKLPINIVIDKEYKVPYIYEYDWEDVEIAQFGSKELNVKGWQEVLDDICWHIDKGIWNKPKELELSGRIKLKIFNK